MLTFDVSFIELNQLDDACQETEVSSNGNLIEKHQVNTQCQRTLTIAFIQHVKLNVCRLISSLRFFFTFFLDLSPQ